MPTACVEIELAKLIARLALEGFAMADVPNDVHEAHGSWIRQRVGAGACAQGVRQWREESEGIQESSRHF